MPDANDPTICLPGYFDESEPAGPSCMWYPGGNAKIVAHAHYDRGTQIGAWASVICVNDCTELEIGITNKNTHPTLIGALRAFQSLYRVHKVDFYSTSKRFVSTMKTLRSLNPNDWNASTFGIWKELYRYAAHYDAKWERIANFKHNGLLLPDSPWFKAYLGYLNGRERAKQALKDCGLC